MNDLLITLDPLKPSSCIFLGLVLILCSHLLRRFSCKPKGGLGNASGPEGILVRIRSQKVVSINRDSRVSRPAGFPYRRVINHS